MFINQKIKVSDGFGPLKHYGRIIGATFVGEELKPVYLIRLDEGFYDPHGGFISILVVHESMLVIDE